MSKKDKPSKTTSGFQVIKSQMKILKEKAQDTGGTQNTRMEAKLDYIIHLLEERG